MAKRKNANPNEAELISWVMPKIAQKHYTWRDDADGKELVVTETSLTTEQILGALCYGRPEEEQQVLLRLRDDCSMAAVRDALVLVLGEKLGTMCLKQFEEQQFEEIPTQFRCPLVLHVAYEQQKRLINSIQRIFVKEREGLTSGPGSQTLAYIESHALPEATAVAIVSHYAEELSRLFPKLIRRAEQLNVLPTEDRAPTEVQTYLQEASKCYIYGQFIACLIVCRSAIDFALRDRLVKHGHGAELESLRRERKDTLENILSLARSALSWELTATLKDANDVRQKANDAVHEKVPKPDTCREMFIKTRGVLRELYS
jgi:hypothetical protein